MSETLKETQVEKEKNIITVDEVEYNIDDLSDELKMIINHVMDLERKISNSQFNIDQLLFGKRAFVEELKRRLEETPDDFEAEVV